MKNKECTSHTDVGIEEIIDHEDFVKGGIYPNDIALIRLDKKIEFTKYIQPICLPLQDVYKTFNFEKFTVIGWGITENGQTSEKKLKVDLPYFDLGDCSRRYGKRLQNTQICAGGERGKDSCKGDSGGALVYLDQTNYRFPFNVLPGVVSFGNFHCGTENVPGIYTKVSSYTDWILDNIYE